VSRILIALAGAASLLCIGTANAEMAAQNTSAARAQAKVQITTQKAANAGKPAAVRRAAPVSLYESGIASIYCFRNGITASGERARPALLTAAHKTLPFGTLVEVTNRQNGRSIVVRINDRGPFIKGRIIDLTPAGARALKFDGLTNVTLRVLNTHRDARIVARAI
jgi:rare lipoprotein A